MARSVGSRRGKEPHPGRRLSWIARFRREERIADLQFWGHGTPGCLYIASDTLDMSALETGHPLNPYLCRIRERFAGPEALWWSRACGVFRGSMGKSFATRWARFFRCRVAGFTHDIGPLQTGLHSLRPGEAPVWSDCEGMIRTRIPQWIKWGPNTITCLHGRVPEEW
jgi:hypothetical protein